MKQQFITIRPEDLLERVARFKKEGCRLVQILCTRTTEGFELTYTFDKNYFLYHLRLTAALGGSVMSITSLYWYGFVWENEIHDLFVAGTNLLDRYIMVDDIDDTCKIFAHVCFNIIFFCE